MFSFFNNRLKSAKDNLNLGLTYIYKYFREHVMSAFLFKTWKSPFFFWCTEPPVSHWDNVEVDGLMASMSNAKVWLDFLCHIKEEVSLSFFYVLFYFIFINLCSFGLAFLQLHGHFVLKSKTMIINRRCEHFVRTSSFVSDVTGLKWVSCHFMLIFKCAINYISNVFW